MPRNLVPLLIVPILLAACGGEPPDTRPGQPVAHRRAAFKELLKAFEPIGVMMRKGPYQPEQFKMLTAGVIARRDAPWPYFQPDTLYPPSRAKPGVWNDPTRFAADKKAFFDATDKLAAVAGTKDEDAARAAFEAVQSACRDCHKAFKNE